MLPATATNRLPITCPLRLCCKSFRPSPAAASPAPRSMPRKPWSPPAVRRSSPRRAARWCPICCGCAPRISSCRESRHPLWARLTLPARLAASLRDASVTLVQARSPATAWVARARGAPARRQVDRHPAPAVRRPRALASRFVEHRQARADARDRGVGPCRARRARAASRRSAGRLETISPGINFDRFDPAIVRADRVIRLAAELRVPDGRHVMLCAGAFDETAAG